MGFGQSGAIIDVIEAEQFIATNILEWSNFAENAHGEEVERMINHYNKIAEEKETDLSLRVQI
ncbi:hypothetical protein [uncultured Desulfovibrio sp.]|uniref:hypothetical protein n=1 Tax=uncultured Desulfovibrio sp. TaxID=167968 RepID=UPI00261D7BE4|nr:hypothetical protein [uncultured Desulfovibrio sp.]